MPEEHPRMSRERRTVQTMIRIYCKGKHGTRRGLCKECEDLQAYAMDRLTKCRFQEGKTTCGKCPIHCYKRSMRERIREVMRYSGPRMLGRHPIMAIRHGIDGRRKEPVGWRKGKRKGPSEGSS